MGSIYVFICRVWPGWTDRAGLPALSAKGPAGRDPAGPDAVAEAAVSA